MKYYLTISTTAFALAFFASVSLANSVPCAGCVLSGDKEGDSGIANLDLAKAVVDSKPTPAALSNETATVDPDCPGCVLVTTTTRAVPLAAAVFSTADAIESTDCPGCVLSSTA